MIQLITRSQETIRGLHDRIWDVVRHVMEKAGKSTADGLEIALRLVDMLPSIPLHLTFHTAIADLPGFTPEALTYASPPQHRPGCDDRTRGRDTSQCSQCRSPGSAIHRVYDGD